MKHTIPSNDVMQIKMPVTLVYTQDSGCLPFTEIFRKIRLEKQNGT